MYVVGCPDEDAELAAAEVWAMTGAEVEGRVAYAPWGVDIARSAYIRACVAIEARGDSFEGLLADCATRDMRYEGFRVEVLRPPPKAPCGSREIEREVADRITGRPNLSAPRVCLAVVGAARGWFFGRLVSRGLNLWRAGQVRPHHFSSALPQRFARALVNLVASPADTLVDPCCGIGTSVIEALTTGVIAAGSDRNEKMLRQLRSNLAHLGLPQRILVADATRLAGRWDAALVDLPYGRNLPACEADYRAILGALRPLVQRAAVVAVEPLVELLEGELGFRCLRLARVPKGQMTRHVHVIAPAGQDPQTRQGNRA